VQPRNQFQLPVVARVNKGDRHEPRIPLTDGPFGSSCDCGLPEPGQACGPPSWGTGEVRWSPGGSEGGQGTLGNLGGVLGGTSVGGLLGSGLRDLVESFQSSGKGEIADSWVKTGPNKPISPQELENAISPEVWATLSEQTGLSRQDLLSRLSRELPEAVDKYTPEGRLPAPA